MQIYENKSGLEHPPLLRGKRLGGLGSLTMDKTHLGDLISKIDNKTAVIGVVGLGYVGVPLLLRYAYAGFKVIGFDVDANKVRKLNGGQSYIEHISSSSIEEVGRRGFQATDDFSRIDEADALIICVPTPLNAYREPDLSYVLCTADTIAPYIREGQVISLESTTYPGTTEEELKPRIEAQGFEVGSEVFLVYSPEREDPGNTKFKTRSIPKVCGGVTEACQQAGLALYRSAIDTVIPVSSTRAAELTKLLENIHRAVNIGLVNEMKIIADRMGIDIHEVIRAAATKPFGFTPYYPGPGLGGHCIPIDPFYLTWKARQYGLRTRFIELAGEINEDMPQWVISKLTNALNENGRALKGSKVLVIGVAYKKDVDDMRESPSLKLLEILRNKGVHLAYCDPHVPVLRKCHDIDFELTSISLTAEAIASFDVVLIATDHSKIDYQLVQQHAKVVVDTRGVYASGLPNVVRA